MRNMSPTGKGSDAQGWDYEAARFDDIDQDTIRRTPTPQHDKLAPPSPTFDVANCVEEPDISDLDLELAHDASPVPEDDELSLLTLTLQPPLSSSTARVGLSDLAIDPAKLETMLTSKGVSCEVRDNYTVLLTAIKYPALAYDKIVIEQQGVFRIDHKTKARSLVCRGRPTTADPSVATTATATTPVGHALPTTIAEQRRKQGEDRPSLDTMLAMHAAWADDNREQLAEAYRQMDSKDSAIKRQGSQTSSKLSAQLVCSIVSYLNQYLMCTQRGRQSLVVQAITTADKSDATGAKMSSVVDIWSVTEFYNFHANWRLPGFKEPITALWHTHHERRQIEQVSFRPTPEDYVEPFRYKDMNLYKGAGITRSEAAEFVAKLAPGESDRMKKLYTDHIVNIWSRGNTAHGEYHLNWQASVVQKPWEKTGVAVVIKSAEGSGKSIIVDKLGKVVGDEYYFPVQDAEDVVGKYTHQLKCCILLAMDEALWGGNKQQADLLKKLITQGKHSVHQKYHDAFLVDSFLEIIFTTNNDWAVPAGPSARRFFCTQASDKYSGVQTPEAKAYFDALAAIPAEVVADLLYNRSLENVNLREVPATELLRDQKMRTLEPLEAWWLSVLNHGDIVCQGWRIERKDRELLETYDDDHRPVPGSSCEAFLDDNWRLPWYKEYVYQAYKQYTSRGNRQFVINDSQFWKDLKKLMPEDDSGQTRMQEKRYQRQVGGKKPRIMLFPSLVECRDHWRRRIVMDMQWTFEEENVVEEREIGPASAAQHVEYKDEVKEEDVQPEHNDQVMEELVQPDGGQPDELVLERPRKRGKRAVMDEPPVRPRRQRNQKREFGKL